MEIQGYQFDTSLYLLDLQGSNVVLGMQWLQTLGCVSHNWENLTMEFSKTGKNYFIEGETTKKLKQGFVHSIQRLMASGLKTFLMRMMEATDHDPSQTTSPEHDNDLDISLARYQLIFHTPLHHFGM